VELGCVGGHVVGPLTRSFRLLRPTGVNLVGVDRCASGYRPMSVDVARFWHAAGTFMENDLHRKSRKKRDPVGDEQEQSHHRASDLGRE
jgi:hypothetical protein